MVASPGRSLPRSPAYPPVQLHAQQPDEGPLTVAGLVMEEGGELSLRQHDRSVELRHIQPQNPLDLLRHGGGVVGENVGAPLEACLPGGRSAARSPAHDADSGQDLPVELEVERYPGLVAGLVDHRRYQPVVLVAGDRSVEGEGDGVDDRRLARSGRSYQRDEVHIGKIDVRPLAERPEALHRDPQRPHRPSPAGASLCSSSSCPKRSRIRRSSMFS